MSNRVTCYILESSEGVTIRIVVDGNVVTEIQFGRLDRR